MENEIQKQKETVQSDEEKILNKMKLNPGLN